MELSVINEQQVLGKNFRVFGTLSRPLFRALDVADWIEHSNVASMLASVDDDEKELHRMDTLNNSYSAWFLTEDGLYEVLMLSRKPLAREFKKKVKIILKSIRQNGGYIANQENLTPEQIVAQALIVANNIIQEKDRLLQEQKPKVLFADAVSTSHTSILVGELAKLINQNGVDIGQNRLFEWLRDNGFLIKRQGTDYNMPTQYSMDLGLFEIKERSIANPDGSVRITKTPKVTGKGQQYFINKFLS